MEYRDLIIENLKKKYSNEIDIARTNIEIFLSSPQGVAEHIDYSETIEKELQKILSSLSQNSFSQIFFIPAIKVNFYLKNFKNFYSGRKILLAREITKLYEAFYRDDVDKINMFKTTVKGELTVVISEKNITNKIFDEDKIIKKAKDYLKKYSLKDVVELLYEVEKINKKKIYDICLKIKNNEKHN